MLIASIALLLLGAALATTTTALPQNFYPNNGYQAQQTNYDDASNAGYSSPLDFNRQIYPVYSGPDNNNAPQQYDQQQFTAGVQSPIDLQDSFNNPSSVPYSPIPETGAQSPIGYSGDGNTQQQQQFVGVQSPIVAQQDDFTNNQYNQQEVPIVGAQSQFGFNDPSGQNIDPSVGGAQQTDLGVQNDFNIQQYNQQLEPSAVLRLKREQPSSTATITATSSSSHSASSEFHTSHRIPEHIEAAIRRDSDENQFQTAHQIGSVHPIIGAAVVADTGSKVADETAGTAATKPVITNVGQRHRRDATLETENSDGSADGEEETLTINAHDQTVADKPAEHTSTVALSIPAAQHGGLHFPVPVDRIVKNSQAAPQIYHHASTETHSSEPVTEHEVRPVVRPVNLLPIIHLTRPVDSN